jgi:aryl-alcohol dehydrogenase-like predicted oxidoreductase
MNYRHLGRSGLLVSPLCLGTMNLGQQASGEDSFVIMDRALDCGINFFDTANRYGVGQDRGHIGYTEEIIGNWFAQGEGRRDKVVLATKLYGSMADWPNFGKLSALNIRRACEASLRRLKTDYIDLYQFHHVDRNTSWDEIWGAMERLVQEGKIVYAGSSNFAGWHIVQANEAALGRHFLGLVSEQSLYNLMERTVELKYYPLAKHTEWVSFHGVRWPEDCSAASLTRHRTVVGQARRCSGRSGKIGPSLRNMRDSARNLERLRRTWRWPGSWYNLPSLARLSVRVP